MIPADSLLSSSDVSESILAAIPGGSENERVLIVLRQQGPFQRQVEMRQQSWSDGIGWFTQNTIHLECDQVDELRYALATAAASTKKQARQTRACREKSRKFERSSSEPSFPRLAPAESA